jgi:hypothetical protein
LCIAFVGCVSLCFIAWGYELAGHLSKKVMGSISHCVRQVQYGTCLLDSFWGKVSGSEYFGCTWVAKVQFRRCCWLRLEGKK